jgi:hypothetical protein
VVQVENLMARRARANESKQHKAVHLLAVPPAQGNREVSATRRTGTKNAATGQPGHRDPVRHDTHLTID